MKNEFGLTISSMSEVLKSLFGSILLSLAYVIYALLCVPLFFITLLINLLQAAGSVIDWLQQKLKDSL